MKLNDRQLLLPVVIGLSLTGVGATLLYFLYKKVIIFVCYTLIASLFGHPKQNVRI